MISEAQIDLLIERLIERTNKANEVFLIEIGKYIKKIKNLSPSKAHQLVQILKYGGNYEQIVAKITKYSELNIKDVDEIFTQYAKKDQNFYEKFYQYRNVPFIPYEENYALKTQTMALSNIVKNEMYDYLRTNVLGYTIKDEKGNLIFKGLKETYNELLDMAVMNVSQGKETFDSAMSDVLRQIGESGLKKIDFNSTYIDKDGIERNRTMRLDSYLRMHIQSNLRELHNENQEIFGKEFGADGVEISVHEFPAPDHERVQGRQFSKKEYANLQAGLFARDYKGNMYTLDHDGKGGYRPISELNCYHYKFDIVLGVSQPEYTDKQLSEIRQRNRNGFELYDKRSGQYRKYTMYEGTQLQRSLERKIREQKDIQILAKESDNKELLEESQRNITQLTRQYKELSEKSGLPSKMDRLKVAGYKRVSTKTKQSVELPIEQDADVFKSLTDYEDFDFQESFSVVSRDLEDKNIEVGNGIYQLGNKLTIKNMEQLDYLTDKYYHDAYFDKQLELDTFIGKGKTYGKAYYKDHKIVLAKNYYSDPVKFENTQLQDIKSGWHYDVPKDKLDVYTLTHEYGHIVEYNYLEKTRLNYDKLGRSFNYKQVDLELRDTIIAKAMNKLETKITNAQFKDKYFSGYAKSKRNYEWFAELFAKMELGEQDVFTEALREWLGDFYGR